LKHYSNNKERKRKMKRKGKKLDFSNKEQKRRSKKMKEKEKKQDFSNREEMRKKKNKSNLKLNTTMSISRSLKLSTNSL